MGWHIENCSFKDTQLYVPEPYSSIKGCDFDNASITTEDGVSLTLKDCTFHNMNVDAGPGSIITILPPKKRCPQCNVERRETDFGEDYLCKKCRGYS